MAEFRKITDVEVVEQMNGNDAFVIERNGKAMRAKAEEIQGVIPTSIPNVQSAAVGQTVVVKAVDENGKPTEWEAADAGGGSAGGDPVVVEARMDMDTMTVTIVPSFEEIAQAFGADNVKKCTLRQIFIPQGIVDEYKDCLMRVHSTTDDEIVAFGVMFPSIDQTFSEFAIMGGSLFFNYGVFHKDGRYEGGTRYLVEN